MEETSKSQSQIEIKHPQPPIAVDLVENPQEHKFPFFKSGSRRRGDTWVISLFVILQIVAFVATMIVNDCWRNSHRDCALKALGRFSFQRLSENPLLGPSSSTLDAMGALRHTFLAGNHQTWRIFTCAGLHGGAIHLIINLCSIIFVGVRLEQEFGPLRTGIVYILSAFVGSLMAALFVHNSPAVGSSGALFGLLGAMLSAILRNWEFYTNKFQALSALFFVFVINFSIGLLPYIDNFSNLGGFISGFLLGFVLLFKPQMQEQVAQTKKGLFEYGVKSSIPLKEQLDRPILRSVSLVLFSILLAGCLGAVLHGININQYCSWCRYVDCVPFKRWSCSDIIASCETRVSDVQLILTCLGNGNFRVFPFTDISESRIKDLCSLLCL